jgi:hypothetical protein
MSLPVVPSSPPITSSTLAMESDLTSAG